MLIQEQTDDFIVRSAPLKSKSFRSDSNNELSKERNGAEQEQDNTDLDPDPDPNMQSSS